MCLDVSHVLGAAQPKFGPFTDRIQLENSASKLRMPWAAKRSTRHNAYWESMGRHSGLPSHSTLESGTLAFSSPSTGGVWAGVTKAPHLKLGSGVCVARPHSDWSSHSGPFLASSTGFGSRCSRIRFRGKSFSMYQRLCSSASINAGRRTPQPVRRFASRRYVPPARGSHISARYRPCPAPDNGLFGLRRTNTDFEGTLTGVPFLICAVCVCVAAVPPSQTERHAPPRVWIITLQPCHTGPEVLPRMFFA